VFQKDANVLTTTKDNSNWGQHMWFSDPKRSKSSGCPPAVE